MDRKGSDGRRISPVIASRSECNSVDGFETTVFLLGKFFYSAIGVEGGAVRKISSISVC